MALPAFLVTNSPRLTSPGSLYLNVYAIFPILKVIEETSKNARKIFIAMLLGCVYSWLTIATTRNPATLTNSKLLKLPIIGTETPMAWFYPVAPLVLLAAFFYLHFYLRRLWEGLAELPARFPDGKRLDQRAYPWLLNGLVRRHFERLRERPFTSHLEEWFTIFLAWWAVPITLGGFWWFYFNLPSRDSIVTDLHIAVIMTSVIATLHFLRLTRRILRRYEFHSRPREASLEWLQRKTCRTWLAMLAEGVRWGFYRPPASKSQSGGTRSVIRWLHERAILDSVLVLLLFVFLSWSSYTWR